MDDNKIIALTHRCAACSIELGEGHLITSAYVKADVTRFDRQVDLGLAGANVRGMWVHLDCAKPSRLNWKMNPDLQTCLRCQKSIETRDDVQPVFQVTNPRMVNPRDPSDVGVALNERMYFVHADCRNPGLDKKSTHILLG